MSENIRHSAIGKYFVKACCSIGKFDSDKENIQIFGLSRLSCATSSDDVGPVANYSLTVQGFKLQTANVLFHVLNH